MHYFQIYLKEIRSLTVINLLAWAVTWVNFLTLGTKEENFSPWHTQECLSTLKRRYKEKVARKYFKKEQLTIIKGPFQSQEKVCKNTQLILCNSGQWKQ